MTCNVITTSIASSVPNIDVAHIQNATRNLYDRSDDFKAIVNYYKSFTPPSGFSTPTLTIKITDVPGPADLFGIDWTKNPPEIVITVSTMYINSANQLKVDTDHNGIVDTPKDYTYEFVLAHEMSHMVQFLKWYAAQTVQPTGFSPTEDEVDAYEEQATDMADNVMNQAYRGYGDRVSYGNSPNLVDPLGGNTGAYNDSGLPVDGDPSLPCPAGSYEDYAKTMDKIIKTADNTPTVIDKAIKSFIDFLKSVFSVQSPLVLDLDNNGIELTTVSNGIHFDHANDGFAEKSAWVKDGDGLLAIDLDGDGRIGSGLELFGNQGSSSNGFLSLKEYDTNGDNAITASDADWQKMLVWVDGDKYGFSGTAELHSLDDLDITSISLNYNEVDYLIEGNPIRQEATFVMNGVSHDIVDAYFQVDFSNSRYVDDYHLDSRTWDIPDAQGAGTMPNLSIAMSLDNIGTGNLLTLVENLDSKSFEDLLVNDNSINNEIRSILFRWAGVEAVDPTSRGFYVDGQELAFLEKLMGEQYLQRGYTIPAAPNGAGAVNQSFVSVFNHFYAVLLGQTEAGELFDGSLTYNLVSGAYDGVTGLNLSRLNELEIEATSLGTATQKNSLWQNVLRLIEGVVGVSGLPAPVIAELEDAIVDSGASKTLTQLIASLTENPNEGDTLTGTIANNTLLGTTGDDFLDGRQGDDTLTGGGGNDRIEGDEDNDVLEGGDGGDYLQGGSGNDTYKFSSSDEFDTNYDQSGIDKILFASSLDYSDITITRSSETDLLISVDDGVNAGSITIADHFISGHEIEKIEFSDTSFINLMNLGSVVYNGSDSNDVMNGLQVAIASIDDVIYGHGGNDKINGLDGNDTLFGGDGNDSLNGGTGNDAMVGGAGNDLYFVDTASDTVTENSSEGTDTVNSSITYILGANLENLILTGSSNVNGTGTVQSIVSWTLAANFENLTLTAAAVINGMGI